MNDKLSFAPTNALCFSFGHDKYREGGPFRILFCECTVTFFDGKDLWHGTYDSQDLSSNAKSEIRIYEAEQPEAAKLFHYKRMQQEFYVLDLAVDPRTFNWLLENPDAFESTEIALADELSNAIEESTQSNDASGKPRNELQITQFTCNFLSSK